MKYLKKIYLVFLGDNMRNGYLLIFFLLSLAFLSFGCLASDKSSNIKADLEFFGMDVSVVNNNGLYIIDWELPGESPYDGIYGLNIIAGVCKSYEIPLDKCHVKMRFGRDVLYETSLIGLENH